VAPSQINLRFLAGFPLKKWLLLEQMMGVETPIPPEMMNPAAPAGALPRRYQFGFFLKKSPGKYPYEIPKGDHKGHYRTRSPTIARTLESGRIATIVAQWPGQDRHIHRFIRFSKSGGEPSFRDNFPRVKIGHHLP
jgi:hypothetical protein